MKFAFLERFPWFEGAVGRGEFACARGLGGGGLSEKAGRSQGSEDVMELGLSPVQVSLGWGLKFRKKGMEKLVFL